MQLPQWWGYIRPQEIVLSFICKTKYGENRRTTQEVTADEMVLYLSTYCRVVHGAEPGSQWTWSAGPSPLMAVADEAWWQGSGRGMMAEWCLSWRQPMNQKWPLRTAGTSAFAADIASPFPFHSLQLLWIQRREKIPRSPWQIHQALLSAREMKSWKSHSRRILRESRRALQQPLAKPLCKHTASPAAWEPATAPWTPIPQGKEDGPGQHPTKKCELKHFSMHPHGQQEHWWTWKHVEFVLDLLKVSNHPRSIARKLSLGFCGSEDIISD